MPPIENLLASWPAILATALSVFGQIQSHSLLTIISVFFFGLALVVGIYARRNRFALNASSIAIEGRSIDSLNAANLTRRTNRSLIVQAVDQLARIDAEDLTIVWEYTGYCRKPEETAIEFSLDSDTYIPFVTLQCVGYDLRRDPQKKHAIRPVLVGSDGMSKKLRLPFLEPIKSPQAFRVLLECKLPGCMKSGLEYYTSTLSFDQPVVPHCMVRLVFAGPRPTWVRVYECGPAGVMLVKTLPASRQTISLEEYVDIVEGAGGQSARVYAFVRQRAP